MDIVKIIADEVKKHEERTAAAEWRAECAEAEALAAIERADGLQARIDAIRCALGLGAETIGVRMGAAPVVTREERATAPKGYTLKDAKIAAREVWEEQGVVLAGTLAERMGLSHGSGYAWASKLVKAGDLQRVREFDREAIASLIGRDPRGLRSLKCVYRMAGGTR